MKTEAEARKCWCPFAKPVMPVDAGYVSGGNRDYHEENGNPAGWPGAEKWMATACIASECMAWRWGGERQLKNATTGELIGTERGGYCGLASKR